MSNNALLLFWTALAAIGASASALAAAVYTALTFRLVRLQSDPHVIVYTRTDPNRPSILVLVIKNTGRDIAHDVAFSTDRPLPSRAFGIEEKTARDAPPMAEGPLLEGIAALGPDTERIVTWGQYGGLAKAIGDTPIVLNYTYRSGKRLFSGNTKLEVRSYLGTDASTKPVIQAVRHLEDIGRKLDRCARHLETLADRPDPRRSRWFSLRRPL